MALDDHPGSAWLAELLAHTAQPPLRPREPLGVDVPGRWARLGSVEPELGLKLQAAGLLGSRAAGQREWAVPCATPGDLTPALNRIADHLRQHGLAGAWRDEQLQVTDEHGSVLGTVERAAVRPLGIRTRAVHLIGMVADGRMWVQQRSWTKANDPGLWDTLMGGMVGASDTLEGALRRETWEEAGLHVEDLRDLLHGGHVLVRGPSGAGSGAMGYMEERIDWYRAVVPAALAPRNQDGEVERFELLDPAALVTRMRAGAFTSEAARVIAASAGWCSG